MVYENFLRLLSRSIYVVGCSVELSVRTMGAYDGALFLFIDKSSARLISGGLYLIRS